MYALTDTEYHTTGTFWGNVCGAGENFMPAPIKPDASNGGVWKLMSTQVTLVGVHGESVLGAHRGSNFGCSLYITWTWKRK